MALSVRLSTLRGKSSTQPLEDEGGPRFPLRRQVSLDEERTCAGHWTSAVALGGVESASGIRLFRSFLLHRLQAAALAPPPCALKPCPSDPCGWWLWWRDLRALLCASRVFAPSTRRAEARRRAGSVPLHCMDWLTFQDTLQELAQGCCTPDERVLTIFHFLADMSERALLEGGFCRVTGWAARYIACDATPWALRRGGWSCAMKSLSSGNRVVDSPSAALAGLAAFVAILALSIYRFLKMT